MDSSKRVKVVGAVLAAVALVAVGVVVVNNVNVGATTVERAEALVKYENADVPLANLPSESEVQTPQGWQVESDKPVDGGEEEDVTKHEEQEAVAEDEDIDSPLDVEEDEDGKKYVAEFGEDVIVTEDEKNDDKKVVAEDRTPRRCFRNLKKCGYRKRCHRVCKRRCRPRAVKICKARKFCKCFCKYFKNIKQARRCVFYKKIACRRTLTVKCLRSCNKYCNRVPRCYCCARRHIRTWCRRRCRKISYATKCGRCRCFKIKCYRYCRFVCRRYK